jgi:NitT/TauT family transport system permease protein
MAITDLTLTRPGQETLDAELSGLDNLEVELPQAPSRLMGLWSAAWPKLAAAAIGLGAWQLLVWSHWRPSYILPGPGPVLGRLWHDLVAGNLADAIATTLRRAVTGYLAAVVIGTLLGLAVAQSRVLRAAVGSLITGFQTMPSVVWLPLAIVLFQLSETAIFFVLLIGAVPSIANGVIAGVDNTPPILLRAGRAMGAKGLARYRHIVLPAALPGFMAGLKQGWAFAWRSLLAGELIVTIAHRPSLGVTLQQTSQNLDYASMYAAMVAILIIGLVLDGVVFGRIERTVLRRRGLGLAPEAAAGGRAGFVRRLSRSKAGSGVAPPP